MLIQTDSEHTPVHSRECYYNRIKKNCPGLSEDALDAAIEVLGEKINAWCIANSSGHVALPELMGKDINGFHHPDEFENSELDMLCGVEYVNPADDVLHERLAAELILTYVMFIDSEYSFSRHYVTNSASICFYIFLG